MAIAELNAAQSEGPPVETVERVVVHPRWRAIGASVRGAAHVRSGLPNQDALAWQRVGSGSGPDDAASEGEETERKGEAPAGLALAVADGHGSAKCFRSEAGARLAVDTALAVLGELAQSPEDVTDLTVLQTAAEQMVWRWRAQVDGDVLHHPLTDEEFDRLEQKDGPGARRTVERSPWIAYGATLVAAMATERSLVYFQLGDGDILVVSDVGEVMRPLATDPRLFANETTSLCSRDAVRHLRVGLHRFADEGAAAPRPPALVVLSTDGYANSFRTDADFVRVGADLLETVRAEGLETVGGCLESWLHEASVFGSGDDVTVGILSRSDE